MDEARREMQSWLPGSVRQNMIDLTGINLEWWLLVSGDESADYQTILLNRLDEITGRLTARPLNSLSREEIFTVIHAYAYKARVYLFAGKYLKGAIHLKNTVDYLKIALDHYREYNKYMLLAGLYHFFASAAMNQNPLLLPFFALAPRGDKQLGIDLLNQCAAMSHPLLSTEAHYFLMKINLHIEEDFDEALRQVNILLEQYPENLLYQYHKLLILGESGQIPATRKQYHHLVELTRSIPGLNRSQRDHFVIESKKFLKKKRIRIFL